MITKTEAFKNAWMAGNQKYILLEFSDGTTLDDDSVLLESFNLEEALCSENQLVFGATSSACFSISVFGTNRRYAGLTVRPTIAAVDDEDNYYVMQFGEYLIESDTRSDDMTYRNLVAYDKLHSILGTNYELFYNNFFETHNSPTIKTFRDAFFDYVGLTQETATLTNDSVAIAQTKVSSYSGSDIIRSICEPNACFGFINYDGKWQYAFPTQRTGLYPSDTLYPSDSLYPKDAADVVFDESNVDASPVLGGVAFEEYGTEIITQVRYHDTIVGTDGCCYRLEENNLLNGLTDSVLENVLNAFLAFTNGFFYTPGSLKGRARPWAQLGDITGIMVDVSGFVSFPILKRSMSGITAIYDTYSATGEERYVYSENDYESYVDSAIEDATEETTELMETLQKELSSTVSGAMDVWATAGAGITYTGYGAPTLETYETEDWNATTDEVGYGNPSIIGYESTDDGTTYLNEETGGIWTLTTTGGKTWTCTGQASKVSTTHYNYEQSDVGKKYLDEEDGKVYVLESYTESGQTKYRWVYSTQLEKVSAQLNSRITQTAQEISTEVSQTYETKSAASSQYSSLSSNISQTAQGILTTVSETYETQSAASSQYSNLSSSISQSAHSIDMSVSSTSGGNAGITISLKDANGSQIDTTGEIALTGVVTFSNNSYASQSYADSAASTAQSNAEYYADHTTIDGGRIDTTTLVAKHVTTTSTSSQDSISITAGSITFGNLRSMIYAKSGKIVIGGTDTYGVAIGKSASVEYGKITTDLDLKVSGQVSCSSFSVSGSTSFGSLSCSSFSCTSLSTSSAASIGGRITVSGGVVPSSSSMYSLGLDNTRWSRLYLVNQPDVSSDRRFKRDIEKISQKYEEFFEQLSPVTFKLIYNDSNHIGFVAQEVKDAMDAAGISEFAGYNDENKDSLSLCYGEFTALNTHMIQKQQARIDALENEVAELKEMVKALISDRR